MPFCTPDNGSSVMAEGLRRWQKIAFTLTQFLSNGVKENQQLRQAMIATTEPNYKAVKRIVTKDKL